MTAISSPHVLAHLVTQLPRLALPRPFLLSPFRLNFPVFAALPLAAVSLDLPSIFESILRVVPKKKQSHSRKRMRQLAGKALKDVTALNTCSGCGRTKKAHLLCPYCVQDIRGMWKESVVEDG